MVKFSYYDGNIYKSNCVGHLTLRNFIDAHLYPTDETQNVIKQIGEASAKGDKKAKAKLKEKLFSFTPSVLVPKGMPRRYASIEKFTGLMQLDFDNIPDRDIAELLKEHIFNMHQEIICIYISPSGLGVKALMSVTVADDVDHYKAIHQSVAKEMDQYGYFDMATKNAILPMFLSMDTELLEREDYTTWTKEDWSKTKVSKHYDNPTIGIRANDSDLNMQKVIRIITSRIGNIVSDGHPQLRTTALILGSRCAAGYIDKMNAEQLIINLVHSNSYLQKGIKGYVETAMWGINEGLKTPKYF